ncbi:hypothetical protein LguiB_028587 [Lonicera macranthoides]
MESEAASKRVLGGSLPVENVQSLASKGLQDVPNRYVRPDIDFNEVVANESFQIPVIDMSKLQIGRSGFDDELAKLHFACKDWGFFQLINHGAKEAIEKMKGVTEEFFKLPLEEKKEYAQLPNNIEGYGQAFVLSEDQKLDWGDISTLDEYSAELHKVSLSLLMLMGKNLGVDPQIFDTMFGNCIQGIRMNYYPPCAQPNKVLGLTPHSDATGLTLLIQVNEVEGLQINKNGKWVPIKPIEGAIIVNIGDILEIMSNGEYSSIEHRAIVNLEKERLSIAGFHNPSFDTKIGPLLELLAKENNENGAKYRTLSHEDYMRMVISTKLDGKNLLDQIKIE